jgi:hypothetical protein
MSSMGATINMHYCMDKFAGFSFTSSVKENCPKCGMKNTGCCKDKKKQIKLTLDQQKTTSNQVCHFNEQVLFPVIFTYDNISNITFGQHNLTYLHAPPILFLKNSQAFFSQFII